MKEYFEKLWGTEQANLNLHIVNSPDFQERFHPFSKPRQAPLP